MRKQTWLVLVVAAVCAAAPALRADSINAGNTSLDLSFTGNTASLTIDSPSLVLTLIQVSGSDTESNTYPVFLGDGSTTLPSDGSEYNAFGSGLDTLQYFADTSDSYITFNLFDITQSCNGCKLELTFQDPGKTLQDSSIEIPYDFEVDPAVPEPSSIALITTGLSVLIARASKRKKV